MLQFNTSSLFAKKNLRVHVSSRESSARPETTRAPSCTFQKLLHPSPVSSSLPLSPLPSPSLQTLLTSPFLSLFSCPLRPRTTKPLAPAARNHNDENA